MKRVNEPENYFVVRHFEEGWGMEDVGCEEQAYDYCIEVLFIPEDKIENLAINTDAELEINLIDLDDDDLSEDWYVNLFRMSKEN